MTDPTKDTAELDRLRDHNAELLADLKKAKAKLAESETALAEKETAIVKAQADLRAIRIDGPVNDAVAKVSVVLPRIFRAEFERYYRFELGEDGKIAIQTLDGKEAKIKIPGKEREFRKAELTEADLYELCDMTGDDGTFDSILRANQKSGSGAPPPGAGGYSFSSNSEKPKPRKEDGLKFGLK
jgi:hypothetical protein